jgi:hypothetical protein
LWTLRFTKPSELLEHFNNFDPLKIIKENLITTVRQLA